MPLLGAARRGCEGGGRPSRGQQGSNDLAVGIQAQTPFVTQHPPGPPFLQNRSGKSILDKDPEAQALLEVSGRSFHSRGVREAPEDE